MNTQPTGNAKMTLENLQSLAEYEGRLSNLENEIGIAKKNLVVVQKDVTKAVKEREYQEEIIENLKKEILELQRNKESLHSSVKEMENYLFVANEEDKKIKEGQESKEKELTDRESKVLSDEDSLKQRHEAIRQETEKQSEDRKLLDNAFNAFSEAVKAVTWK